MSAFRNLSTLVQRVVILVRQSSLNKPQTKELETAGAQLRTGDIATDSVEQLVAALNGVDIVISLVLFYVDQRNLIRAAKEAGVKRVVPSEFGPYIRRGVMTPIDMVGSIVFLS